MANLKQYLQSEVDRIQMQTVRNCNNIEKIKQLIDLFERMNEVIQTAPDVTVTVEEKQVKKKVGRRKKEDVAA